MLFLQINLSHEHTQQLLQYCVKQIKRQQIMIDSQSLLKKLRVISTRDPLQNSSRIAQLKLSKQIYNNRSIREIGKFIREAQSVLRKSQQGHDERRVVTEYDEKKAKGRYDQNQLMELNYQFQSIRKKYLVDMDSQSAVLTRRSGQTGQTQRKMTLKRRKLPALQDLNKQGLMRRPTFNNHNSALPITRMKSISFSSYKQYSGQFNNKIKQLKQPPSALRLKNRVSYNMENPEVKINLKQNQLQEALDNLITLIGTKQSKNHHIPHDQIFQKIQKYYKLKSQPHTHSDSQKQKIHPMSPTSAHNPHLHPNPQYIKHHIQLPFCQFTNYKDCRKSIQRIFNMSLKAAQRIAFKIYDRNDNGVIDERDIIQLFTIAEGFQAMQEDMEIIVKNYKVNNANNNAGNMSNVMQKPNSIRSSSPRRFPRKMMTMGDQSDFSIEKLNKIQVIQQNPKPIQKDTMKFHKQVFFTFKQSKQQFFKKKAVANSAISLTWTDFQQAFKNTRPQIYYDLLDYLFGINSVQIYERAFKAAYEQDKKSYRIVVFNNSDGRSEYGGSNYVEDVQPKQLNKLTDRRDKKSLNNLSQHSGSKISKLSKIKTIQQKQGAQESPQVDQLIGKVKSIEQFDLLKYL